MRWPRADPMFTGSPPKYHFDGNSFTHARYRNTPRLRKAASYPGVVGSAAEGLPGDDRSEAWPALVHCASSRKSYSGRVNRRQIFSAVFGALLLFIAFAAPDGALANTTETQGQMEWSDLLIAAFIGGGAAALLGHLLTLVGNVLARTYFPKIETSIQCEFFPPQGGQRPIELRFMVTNSGGSRSRFARFTFWVRGIGKGDRLLRHRTGRVAGRLKFPNKLFDGEFLPPPRKWLFVEPGTTQAFMRPVMIPDTISLILVRVTIVLTGGRTYTEERIIPVPAAGARPDAVSPR